MINNVVHHPMPRALAEDAKHTGEMIAKELRPFATELTVEEKRRRARFRPGGPLIALRICAVAEQSGVRLPFPIQDVRDDLALIEQLAPLLDAVEALLQLLEDTS